MLPNIGITIFVFIEACLIIKLTDQSSLEYYQMKHRIRHQRRVLGNIKNSIKYSENAKECFSKSWDNINIEQNNCPQKRCTFNGDCWSQYGPSTLCVCDPYLCGLVCMEDRRCPVPEQPNNGQANYTTLAVGDQVEYTCRPGYAVKGPRKRYCQANLRLSGTDPECTDQTDVCFSAPYIPNTQVFDGNNRDDFKNGEKVQIVCQNGFEDTQTQHIIATCYGNEWKYPLIKCRRKSCGKLENPKNGRAMYNNFTYQSVAIQFCNDGFKINCSHDEKNCKRICEADGRWSGHTAICNPILCPELHAPENGEIIGFWNTVNSIKTFKCKEGYQLNGSHLRKCTHEGYWDGLNSFCVVRNCGPPPEIQFSEVIYESTTHGANAEYKCKSGTTLIGKSSVLTCGEINNKSGWLPKPNPQCLLHCSSFRVENAKRFVNDANQPIDIIYHHKIPHQTIVKVICNAGYKLRNDISTICNNGTWTDQPICEEASCLSRPPSMKYSTVRFFSLKHNSLARYYCHFGYRIFQGRNGLFTLNTTFDIHCIKGNWTKMPPEGCQPMKCSKPQTPSNGEIYLLGQSDRTRLTDESIKLIHNRNVKYECHADFRLKGPKIAVCLNGQWSPPEIPKCEKIMHDELPISWLYYQSNDKK